MKKLLLTLGFALSLTMNAQVPSYLPTNGLVGYWPFTGNANDVSGNGNNGTNNGATLTTDRFGNANSAYSFNGTAGSVITASPALPIGNTSRTISVWVKTSSVTGGSSGRNLNIMVNWGLNQNGKMCELDVDLGSATFQSFGAGILNSNTTISDNLWHNVIGTHDSTSSLHKIYIDGVLKGTLTATFSTTLSNLFIGERNGEIALQKMDGSLDDIGIWNRALTQQEITNIYNSQTTYSDTCNAVSGSLVNGLVAYYPFCGNANDDSGHGNNGTVNGATLTTDRFGNVNSAYNFNGTSNINTNFAGVSNQSSRTISFWYNLALSNTTTQEWVMVGYGGDNAGTSFVPVIFPNNTPGIDTGASYINYNLNTLQGWHFYTVSYDSTNGSNVTAVKLYIDGQLLTNILGTFQSTTTIQTGSSYKFRIGNNNPSSTNLSQGFKGKIDDIGFWNRALTPAEITSLYNQNQCFTSTTVTDTLVINVGQMSYTNPVAYANNITIYPNPASTQVNISFNNITDLTGGSIKIINSLGQQVATTPITTTGTTTTMALSTWGGSGLYFVQIINSQGQIVDIKKILLQ